MIRSNQSNIAIGNKSSVYQNISIGEKGVVSQLMAKIDVSEVQEAREVLKTLEAVRDFLENGKGERKAAEIAWKDFLKLLGLFANIDGVIGLVNHIQNLF